MVNGPIETRSWATYALGRIRELAEHGLIVYASPSVRRDIENLEYESDAVSRCLAALEEGEFRRSLLYSNHRQWLDEYHTTYRGPRGHLDHLYIKLSLNRRCTRVVVYSFHLER